MVHFAAPKLAALLLVALAASGAHGAVLDPVADLVCTTYTKPLWQNACDWTFCPAGYDGNIVPPASATKVAECTCVARGPNPIKDLLQKLLFPLVTSNIETLCNAHCNACLQLGGTIGKTPDGKSFTCTCNDGPIARR